MKISPEYRSPEYRLCLLKIYGLILISFSLTTCFYNLPTLDNPYDPLASGTESGTKKGGAIPVAAINVDGKREDWDDIDIWWVDATGDTEMDFSGGDILRVGIAHDDSNLYWMLETSDNTINTEGCFYILHFHDVNEGEHTDFNQGIYHREDGTWEGVINVPNADGSYSQLASDSSLVALDEIVEATIPLDYFPDFKSASMWPFVGYNGEKVDDCETIPGFIE